MTDGPGGESSSPDDPPAALKLRELEEFLLYLGSALSAAGEAVNHIEEHLRGVAAAYGAPDARVSVLPTYLVVALEPGRPATLEPTRQLRGILRLDQIAALFEVLKAAERTQVSPREASTRIRQIVLMAPRFGPGVTIFGHIVLTLGICLLLEPSWGDLALAAAFGAFVGAFKLVGARWPSVQMITPVTAAFVIATVTFLLAGQGWADADLRAMVPPIVTFLPGGTLTMAVVELAAAEMVSGTSRLVTGAVQLVLLAFGITGAAQVVGIPSGDALVDGASNLTGAWWSWLAVLLVGVGNYLYFSAPRGSLGWLCLVLVAAGVGQYLGDLVLGSYLSGFVGAIVMTPVAYLVERRPSGPPALVSFLPAFWLLVPGALSLIGVTEYLGQDAVAGAEDLLGAVNSMVAIALGVPCGYPLYRSLARSFGWLREFTTD
jgi:uncharacterized membrane protein YjjP (DUF1212 family)